MFFASTTTPILAAGISALAVVGAGLGGGWFASRRLNSGKVDTSDAATLWAEAEKLRILYRDEAIALREEAAQLRRETQILRDEAIVMREEIAAWHLDINKLRAALSASETETAELRKQLRKRTTGTAPTAGTPPKDNP